MQEKNSSNTATVSSEGRQPCPLLPGPQFHCPIYPAYSHRLPGSIECQSADRGSWGS